MFRLQFLCLPTGARYGRRPLSDIGPWSNIGPEACSATVANAVDAVLRLVQPARMHVITELHP